MQDGTSKMSKSAENDASRINLTDSPKVIADKIKRCKTDTADDIAWDPERPEANNLLTIYQLATGRTKVRSKGGRAGASAGTRFGRGRGPGWWKMLDDGGGKCCWLRGRGGNGSGGEGARGRGGRGMWCFLLSLPCLWSRCL